MKLGFVHPELLFALRCVIRLYLDVLMSHSNWSPFGNIRPHGSAAPLMEDSASFQDLPVSGDDRIVVYIGLDWLFGSMVRTVASNCFRSSGWVDKWHSKVYSESLRRGSGIFLPTVTVGCDWADSNPETSMAVKYADKSFILHWGMSSSFRELILCLRKWIKGELFN